MPPMGRIAAGDFEEIMDVKRNACGDGRYARSRVNAFAPGLYLKCHLQGNLYA